MERAMDHGEGGEKFDSRPVRAHAPAKVYSKRLRFAPRPRVFLSVGRPIIVLFSLSPSLFPFFPFFFLLFFSLATPCLD